MTTRVDAVVIGAGVMGSAAARQVARTGRSVVVLEQFASGHSVGASHGTTRNLSAAYPGDLFQQMLTETRALWRQLEEESGETLIDWVGLAQHGWQQPLRELRAAHERHGVSSAFLTAEEAGERWRGLRFAGPVLVTADAGRIRADAALRVLRALAETDGAVFAYENPVREVEVRGDTATVHVDSGSYVSEHVIVTAGAWTTKLLGASLGLPRLRVTQEQPAHFGVLDPEHVWPGFMHEPEPGAVATRAMRSTVYGMFAPGHGVKAGWHGTGAETDPDRRSFAFEPGQMDALRDYVREWIPGADPDSFDPISCTYTTTPTEDFVLDRRGPLIVGAGFSGHGFKFAPVVGRTLAGLLEGEPASERFRLSAPGSPARRG